MASVTKTDQVYARVPTDLLERVEKLAEADERTVSYIVRKALLAYVEAAEQEAAA